jgi:hypothetical protein
MTDKTRDLVRPHAASFRALQPGQMMPMDERGRSVSGWRAVSASAWSLKWDFVGLGLIGAGLYAALEAIALPAFLQFPVVFGILYGFIRLRGRPVGALVDVQRALAAGKIEEAGRLLALVPRSRRRRVLRYRARLEGYIAEAKGDSTAAIACYARGLALAGPGFERATIQASLAGALARSGQLERARQLRAAIRVAKDADGLRMTVLTTDLWLAYCGNRALELDEDTVHAWVRMSLEHNHTRNELVVLAWILEARGDPGLAAHCLTESANRFSWVDIRALAPALADWAASYPAT